MFSSQNESVFGVVDCPQAFKLAKKLQEECAEFARLSQNETYWNLSHRSIVIAWLKACVLYVANGCQWVHRKYVLQVTDDSFVKSDKYKKKS